MSNDIPKASPDADGDGETNMYVVVCGEHGVLEANAKGWLTAELVADDHQENEDCEGPVRRWTHAQWEELKKTGSLREELVEQANSAINGP